jgi:Mlc titration factor MtfA (ptsG expression regulator)
MVAASTGCVPQYALLDDHQRERYTDLARGFAWRLHWEPAYGFTLTDEMIGMIAGHVALMALGLDPDAFRGVRTVVVHPDTIVLTGARRGPSPYTVTDDPRRVLGHTTATGPVFIRSTTLPLSYQTPK